MTDTLRKAAQDILDSYDAWQAESGSEPDERIEALRAALAETPEPVAFRANVDGVWFVASTHKFMKATLEKSDVTAEIHPLYTTPPNIDALIAEIDEVIFDEYSGGYFHRLDIGGAEITDVLDKYRSTGNESND